jgi:hypothetical protein
MNHRLSHRKIDSVAHIGKSASGVRHPHSLKLEIFRAYPREPHYLLESNSIG